LTEAKVTVPREVEKLTTAWASDGKTLLYAVAQGRLLGAFAVEDEIRPVSSEAVTELPQLGIGVQFVGRVDGVVVGVPEGIAECLHLTHFHFVTEIVSEFEIPLPQVF
jgi:Cu2+-exporting ATPase